MRIYIYICIVSLYIYMFTDMYRHKVVSLLQDDLAILEGEAAVHQDLNINRVIYVFTNLYYDISYAYILYFFRRPS